MIAGKTLLPSSLRTKIKQNTGSKNKQACWKDVVSTQHKPSMHKCTHVNSECKHLRIQSGFCRQKDRHRNADPQIGPGAWESQP